MNSTLDLLDVEPEHQVLDIGFGGGYALQRLCKILKDGVVFGVDVSPDMVRQAQHKFRRQIGEGRVRVHLADICDLPFETGVFDRVFTVNTIYFWPDPLKGATEIRRVLKPRGRAAVSLRSKDKMQAYSITKFGFQLFNPAEAVKLMREAGFEDVRFEHNDKDKMYDEVIVLGDKGDD